MNTTSPPLIKLKRSKLFIAVVLKINKEKKNNGVSARNNGKACCRFSSSLTIRDIKYQEIPKGKVKYNLIYPVKVFEVRINHKPSFSDCFCHLVEYFIYSVLLCSGK